MEGLPICHSPSFDKVNKYIKITIFINHSTVTMWFSKKVETHIILFIILEYLAITNLVALVPLSNIYFVFVQEYWFFELTKPEKSHVMWVRLVLSMY